MTMNLPMDPPFGLGYVHPLDQGVQAALRPLRDDKVGLIRSPSPTSARELDCRDVVDRVRDQGQSGLCVFFSSAESILFGGIVAENEGRGPRVSMPSIRHWHAIAQWRVSPGQPLVDIGSSPGDACGAAVKDGLVADARWPIDEALLTTRESAVKHVCEDLPIDLDLAAWDAKLRSWHFADGDSDPLGACKQALDLGFFPTIALKVYEDFMYDAAGIDLYDVPKGKELGAHQVLMVGYAPGRVLLLNSWSQQWGKGGYLWVSERFFLSPDVLARTVIDVIPSTR